LFSRSNAQRDRTHLLEQELADKTSRLELSEKQIEEQRSVTRQQRNEFTQKILQQAADQLKHQAATETRYLERVKQIQREKTEAAGPLRSNTGTVIDPKEPGQVRSGAAPASDLPALPGGALVANPREKSTFLGVLRPKPGYTAVGAVSWDARDQRGTIVVEQLAPSVAEKDYQLWLFTEDGRIVSGGVIKLDTEGHLVASYLCKEQVDSVTGFKVTQERAGGVPAPGQGSLVLETN
jgi:hypothetical protein